MDKNIYEEFFKNSEEGFFIVKNERIVECNRKGLELFGCSNISEFTDNFISDFSPKFQPDGQRSVEKINELLMLARQNSDSSFKWLHKNKQGDEFYSELSFTEKIFENDSYLFITLKNINDEVRTADQLFVSLQFEKIITKISHRFLNINPVEIEKELGISLNEICDFQNIEWAAIYLLTDDEESSKNLLHWVSSSDSSPRLESISVPEECQWLKTINSEKRFCFSSLKKAQNITGLSVEYLKMIGVKSLVDFPLYWGASLIGIIRFANNFTDNEWSETQLNHLKLVAEILNGVILKRKKEILFSETNDQFRSLINATSSAIIIVRDRKVIFKNQLAQDLIGDNNKFNENIISFIRNDRRAIAEKILDKIINFGGGAVRYEIPVVKENGDTVWLDISVGKILYKKQLALIVTGFDISKRKLAEERLKDYKDHLEVLVEKRTIELASVNNQLHEEIKKLEIAEREIRKGFDLLQTLINNVPIPLLIIDKNKYFIDCNKEYLAVTGKKKSDVIDRLIDEVVKVEHREQFSAWFEEAIACKTSLTKQGILFDVYNNTRDVIFYSAPFEVGFGTLAGIIVVLWDITESKRAEAEMLKLIEKQIELNEVKGNFISTVTHEFKTPLTTVVTSADYLRLLGNKLDAELPEKYYEHITRIKNSVAHLTELIDDLLTFSKSETGRLEIKNESVNIKSVCENTIEEITNATPKDQEISFRFELEKETILIDSKLLRWILVNLFTNSVKYTPHGGKIKIKVIQKENELELVVSDSGIGIPEKDRKRIFEPFYRSMNVGEVMGTGLGLSIAKKAVDIYRGSISFTSDNFGTTFNVILPLYDQH